MQKKTRILITVKKDVLDPAGVALKKALMRQGFSDIADVRVGKMIDIVFKNKECHDDHLPMLKKAATTILSNPIMEECDMVLLDEGTDER